MGEVEGFSARGVLAAMLSSPWAVAAFASLSAGAVAGGRWLDLNGDDFGLAAARPLHLIGIGILALVVGRWLALLPAPIDIAALAAAWAGVAVPTVGGVMEGGGYSPQGWSGAAGCETPTHPEYPASDRSPALLQ